MLQEGPDGRGHFRGVAEGIAHPPLDARDIDGSADPLIQGEGTAVALHVGTVEGEGRPVAAGIPILVPEEHTDPVGVEPRDPLLAQGDVVRPDAAVQILGCVEPAVVFRAESHQAVADDFRGDRDLDIAFEGLGEDVAQPHQPGVIELGLSPAVKNQTEAGGDGVFGGDGPDGQGVPFGFRPQSPRLAEAEALSCRVVEFNGQVGAKAVVDVPCEDVGGAFEQIAGRHGNPLGDGWPGNGRAVGNHDPGCGPAVNLHGIHAGRGTGLLPVGQTVFKGRIGQEIGAGGGNEQKAYGAQHGRVLSKS